MSLELGIPAAEIEQWPEAELRRYLYYADRHMLPLQRQEFYLAQIAYVMAVTMGGFSGEMTDLMLHTGNEASDETETEDEEDIADIEAQLDALG